VSTRVLLVEDDDSIGDPLEAGLRRDGYEVSRARTAAEARSARPDAADLVVLDLGLPDGDGLDVCRELRARSAVPIIIVTARGEEVDRVLGLELGADDYLVKPFGVRELAARMRAVLRRTNPSPRPPGVDGPQRLGSVVLDRRTRTVTVDGAPATLTRKEFDLLVLLAEDPGAVRTREEILSTVWDANWYGPTKTLDVHVASLRKKLGDPTVIETVRGVGFRLRP
jgi:DNA-binding response OmpR family regulator